MGDDGDRSVQGLAWLNKYLGARDDGITVLIMMMMALMVTMVMTMKMTKLILFLFNRVILRLGWRRPRVGTTMTM